MTRNELYDLEKQAYKELVALKKETHIKTEAYCEGLEKGWDMMFKAVRNALPLWCEDCAHFGNTDMGGEGDCDIDGHYTWYGCPICENYKPKGARNEQLH